RKKWVGISFALLSALSSIASHIGLAPIIDYRNYSDDQVLFYFVVNSVIFILFTPALLFFTLGWNFEAERKLVRQHALANEQNKQMLKINEELDQFVYKTSHDLRAPLNEILLMANEAARSKDQRQFLFVRMKNQVVLMDEYIREIIDYSRNSRIELRTVSMHVPTLIDELWASLDTVPGYNSIEFSSSIVDVPLVSDPERLKTIVRNLAFNAIKYRDPSKPKSTISITTDKTQSEYWITVADNGIGIDQHHQQRIFEMFYKGTEQSKGSGLGLYMVKENVAKLGGNISLRSSIGLGSEFIVKLPFQERVDV
ncbi:MAG: sensor histidine kinase, partial [Flammeovirgaceae bacterium]